MSTSSLIAYLASIPKPIQFLTVAAMYGAIVRWRFRPSMAVDGLLIGLLVYRPSIGLLAWVACLIGVRHIPLLAIDFARLLRLDSFEGMTNYATVFLLPGVASRVVVMSRSEDEQPTQNGPIAVHVPGPGTAGSPDTNAIDESPRDQFLFRMIDERDERGGYLFTANQIHKAIGGHRATVLAKVRDRRSATLPPLYRNDTGIAAPATHPITRDPHGPAL